MVTSIRHILDGNGELYESIEKRYLNDKRKRELIKRRQFFEGEKF